MTDISLHRRIDRICNRYEDQLREGQRPGIKQLLDLVPEEGRKLLFAELVQLELQFRVQAEESCQPSDYLSQFGEFREEVQLAFDRLQQERTDTSILPEQRTLPQEKTGNQARWDTVPPADAEDTDTPTIGPTSPNSSSTNQVTERIRYFGDFEIIEEIARGGMGVVYKARQVSLNRVVALKMILAGQLAGDEEVQRFHAEAEAAANLDHPGIVPIYEIGQHEDQHYFSMGFVDGESLADRVKDGPLAPRDAAETMKKVAEAVAYAHENGVIHRDLKPANVLIDSHNQPKVTDFGLAKQVESDSDLTRTGAVMGTPSYMPPEQASGKTDEIAELADVYSLGAILYCLITGRPPFQAANAIDTLMQVIEHDVIPPQRLNSVIPTDLANICLKCLSKQTHDRYPTTEDLVADLERYVNGDPVMARPPRLTRQLTHWLRKNIGSIGWTVLAGGLTGVILSYQVVAVQIIPVVDDLTQSLEIHRIGDENQQLLVRLANSPFFSNWGNPVATLEVVLLCFLSFLVALAVRPKSSSSAIVSGLLYGLTAAITLFTAGISWFFAVTKTFNSTIVPQGFNIEEVENAFALVKRYDAASREELISLVRNEESTYFLNECISIIGGIWLSFFLSIVIAIPLCLSAFMWAAEKCRQKQSTLIGLFYYLEIGIPLSVFLMVLVHSIPDTVVWTGSRFALGLPLAAVAASSLGFSVLSLIALNQSSWLGKCSRWLFHLGWLALVFSYW